MSAMWRCDENICRDDQLTLRGTLTLTHTEGLGELCHQMSPVQTYSVLSLKKKLFCPKSVHFTLISNKLSNVPLKLATVTVHCREWKVQSDTSWRPTRCMKRLDDFQCNKIRILISVLIPFDNNHQRQCEGGGDIPHIGEKYDEKKSDVGQVVPLQTILLCTLKQMSRTLSILGRGRKTGNRMRSATY